MNFDSENPPPRVQAILNGGSVRDRPCCSGCRVRICNENSRMLRCSRCRVAHYCSRECQKAHFGFHKSYCKHVGKLYRLLEQRQPEKQEGNNDDANRELLDSNAHKLHLARTLVRMGYRETDTIINGSAYYRRALQFYMELLINNNKDDDIVCVVTDSQCQLVEEDEALLLLVILGGDVKMLLDWCRFTASPRLDNYMPRTAVEAPFEFKTTDGVFAVDDFAFQALFLLVFMRSLAEYRQNLNGFQVYNKHVMMQQKIKDRDDTVALLGEVCQHDKLQSHILSYLLGNSNNNGKLHMDALPEDIRLCIAAIRHHGNGRFLLHLRDDTPLQPGHAPKLLRGSKEVVPEFWYLYQDCFFLTPGVNAILHEFLPEEKEDNDSVE